MCKFEKISKFYIWIIIYYCYRKERCWLEGSFLESVECIGVGCKVGILCFSYMFLVGSGVVV